MSPGTADPGGRVGESAGGGVGRGREGVGRIVEFDGDVGLGRIEADGGASYPFHCVAIADGTRRIELGVRVRFRVVAGLPGRWEAGEIRPAGAAAASL
jgi:cold shock CspA family protein